MIPALATRIAEALRDHPTVRALFLGGSHGNGLSDAYSDLDLVLVSEGGGSDELAALLKQAIAQTGQIVMWRDRTVTPVLINAITAPANRIDVLMYTPADVKGYAQDRLQTLFDHDDILASLPKTTLHCASDPKRMAYQFEEFIRILGLLPLAIGREEYINGVAGIFHLRNLLVELLIAETNASNRGGALQLNRLLTEEQRDLLISLPPPIATREGVIRAHKTYAAAYLHRARAYANQNAITWPEQFEDAILTYVGEALDIQIFEAP